MLVLKESFFQSLWILKWEACAPLSQALDQINENIEMYRKYVKLVISVMSKYPMQVVEFVVDTQVQHVSFCAFAIPPNTYEMTFPFKNLSLVKIFCCVSHHQLTNPPPHKNLMRLFPVVLSSSGKFKEGIHCGGHFVVTYGGELLYLWIFL